MLSESWLKDMHHCLVLVKVHISDKESLRRTLMMIKTMNQITLIANTQVEDSPEESEHGTGI